MRPLIVMSLLAALVSIGFTDQREVYSLDGPRPVKVPRVLQRMYRDWASKPKYESKLIQSIPVQVTYLGEHSLLMKTLFSESKNTTVRKAELWMEFPNVQQPFKVRNTEYSIDVHHARFKSDACITSVTKKPQLRDRQIELAVDITSLYINCRDKNAEYQQLKLHMSTESTNFLDLTSSKMDAFIILQEMVGNDDEEPEKGGSADTSQIFFNSRLQRNKRSTDSKSLFIGHVIKEFRDHEIKDMKEKLVDPARLTEEFLQQQESDSWIQRKRLARDKVLAEVKNEGQMKDSSRSRLQPTEDQSFRKTKAMANRQKMKTPRGRRRCGLHRWFVKFEDIGWNWVIAPAQGFEANRCQGKCLFPLSAEINSTNHAVVQTLINSIFGKPKSSCCVPNETSSLTLLFLEDNGTITMKKYPNMIVNSCACL